MNKKLIVVVNGAGTNGAELKSLYKRLSSNEEYFVYYPGYMPGMFVGDYFPKAKVKDFIRFVDNTIVMMNEKFSDVHLIGYSLGASTAAVLASRCKKISKVVLISPVLKNPNFRKFFTGVAKSLSAATDLTRVQRVFFSEFIRRFQLIPKIELFHAELYLRYAKKHIKNITQKLLIVETLKDEVVKKSAIDWIIDKVETTDIDRYEINSSHFLFFDKENRNQIIDKIDQFLKED